MRFQDIPGHHEAKSRLTEMVDSDKIPHALLLSGPGGVGKMAMARALVQYIHCTDRHDGDSCGHCPACLQHKSNNHISTHFSFPVLKKSGSNEAICDEYLADWNEFLAESPFMDFDLWRSKLGNPNGQPAIYVEESADIINRLKFTSRAGRQVIVMWLPERMRTECANKLLKIIEEPMGDTVFILVSNDPEGILPTIYSRVQRIELNRLPDADIRDYLTARFNLSATDAASIARLAEGSLLEAGSLASGEGDRARNLEYFKQLMRLAYQRNVGQLRAWANEVAGLGREGATAFLKYAVYQMRENLIMHLQVPQLNFMTVDERQFAERFHVFINHKNVLKLVKETDDAIRDIQANANAKIVLFEYAVRIIMLIRLGADTK